MATTMRRPVDLAPPSRAAQRKQRLLELENEQRIEDAEALKMTEEQRLSLFHSFRSVKFEWSDLDGMRSVRRRYNSPPRLQLHPHAQLHHPQTQHQQQPAPTVSVPPPQPQAPAFAVLTNARLASFSADDTICLRRSASSSTLCPTLPSSTASSPALSPLPTPVPHAPAKTSPKTHTHTKPKAKKARSPVKGLFAFPPSPPTPAPATGAIRVPRPPLAAVDEDGDAWVDEEGWVDDDADAFGGDTEVEGDDRELELQDREGDEGEEEDEDDEGDDTFDESALPTPVPRAWCFADAIPIEVERPYATPDTPRESGYTIASPYPASPVASPAPASPYATASPAPAPVYTSAPTPPSPYAADAPTAVGGKRKR
ncbi:hypothetical protein DFH09DRAFT_100033 [Mycena vulgaris]|nr:hypothetical protein DFH09DRAFT_100033 [Mycena vulgaris]